jgi:putative endonuclease
MEKLSTRSKGKQGEEIAAQYLMNNGYRIVEKNYKNNFGEIDVVAFEGDTVVFVEVKARNTSCFGHPSEAVDLRKQQRLCKIAAAYLVGKRLTKHPIRFDVVSVCGEKIEVIKDAFELQGGTLW